MARSPNCLGQGLPGRASQYDAKLVGLEVADALRRAQLNAPLWSSTNCLVVIGARLKIFRIGSVFSVESAPFAAMCAAVSWWVISQSGIPRAFIACSACSAVNIGDTAAQSLREHICKFGEIAQHSSEFVDFAEVRHRIENYTRPYCTGITHVDESERQVGGERQYDLVVVLDRSGLCKGVLHKQTRAQDDPFDAARPQSLLDCVMAAPDDRRRIRDDQKAATGDPHQKLHTSFQGRVEHIVLLLDHVWIVTCHNEDARHALKRALKRRLVSQFGNDGLRVRAKNLARLIWVAHDANRIMTQLFEFLDNRPARIAGRPHNGDHDLRSPARVRDQLITRRPPNSRYFASSVRVAHSARRQTSYPTSLAINPSRMWKL